MIDHDRWYGRIALTFLAATLLVSMPATARAHFVWLFTDTGEQGKTTLYMSFAEGPIPEGAELVDERKLGRVFRLGPDGVTQALQLQLNSESQAFEVAVDDAQSIYAMPFEYGLFTRGESSMKLCYYAMTAPAPSAAVWRSAEFPKSQRLYVAPSLMDGRIRLAAHWDGEPLADSEIVVEGPKDRVEVTTGSEGFIDIDSQGPGQYDIRAKHVENQKGEIDGTEYSQVVHYATLTFPVEEAVVTPRRLPPMENAITSFGAWRIGEQLYVYGGHFGEAHQYTAEEQGRTLMRLDLRDGESWEAVADGEGMQGLALVGHRESLYRIGGLQARNDRGADHELWSLDAFLRYQVDGDGWEELPNLPEPRSSFDATILDGSLYIAGGWNLSGQSGEAEWLTTAYRFDLQQENGEWVPLAKPPFERRAVALAPFHGKLYVLGGMSHKRGPSTAVDIYDPATDSWTRGPSLPGEGIQGFGTAAAVIGDSLYATTMDGGLHRMRDGATEWELVRELETPRFFHRMIAVGDRYLLLIGGADMEVGKFDDLEWVDTLEFSDSKEVEFEPSSQP